MPTIPDEGEKQMSSVDDATQTMIDNLAKKTGKTLEEWIEISLATKITKTRELLNWLKMEHGLTHGYANMVAIKALETLSGAPTTNEGLVETQYAGAKSGLKPLYDRLVDILNGFGVDVEISPKKAYVSIRRKKQFAIIQPSTAARLDVGINLKDHQPAGRLEASGSFNAMVSHRVRLEVLEDVNDELIAWLKEAYEAA